MAKIWMLCISRHINWPGTFEFLDDWAIHQGGGTKIIVRPTFYDKEKWVNNVVIPAQWVATCLSGSQ